MRHYNITYYFAYTVENSSKINFYETTPINTAEGGEKEAIIELIKAVPEIVDYLLYDTTR
jgi:hypothetical protein|tara:strand:- start:88 stop:267 length:180 start_codon:yes stop_codon:yes gene_type:complete